MNVGYVSLSIGFLLTFAMGAVMDWRLLSYNNIILPTVSLLGLIFFLPETPIWLLRHNQTSKAYEQFLWLRGDADLAQNELNEHLVRLEQEKLSTQQSIDKNSCRDYLQPSVIKPIIIIFGFILLFNISGTYLIVYYALDIINQVDLATSAQNISVILSIVRLIVTIGFCWLFMRIQRRRIYLIAGIGSTLTTLILALYLHQKSATEAVNSYDRWIASALLLIYVATNTGFMIAPGFMTGELLPAKIRGRLAGYIYTFFSIVTFVLNKIFPSLSENYGAVGILIVFGVGSLATTALIYMMVPETKDKTLLEIERYFEQNGWIYKSKTNKSTIIE